VRRSTLGRLLLIAAGVALVTACGGDPQPPASEADAARRQNVRAFWQRLSAATDARMRGDCAAASTLYKEALALDPRHEDALYYLAQCLRQQGRPTDARAAFDRLVEVNQQSARGHLALGSLLASPDPAEPLDLSAAESHLRRAHEINGEETGPIVRLGEVLLVLGRRDEAGQCFESALRTNPKSVEGAFLAGFVAWDSGSADLPRLLERVRTAATVEAPVKGVLSEGDRKDAHRIAAPPLARPLGLLLFGEPIATLRARSAAGQGVADSLVIQLWRDVQRLRSAVAVRAATADRTSR
jgi:tetratricopeptide (TPR) repeat protein